MKIIDISMKIEKEMPVYKNLESKRPQINIVSDFSKNQVQESELKFNLHTGTHFDMPLHMIKNGKSSNDFELSLSCVKCLVLDFSHVEKKITDSHLKQKTIYPGLFVLLKTKNSNTEMFDTLFTYLDVSGAEYLAQNNVVGVGIDALGIERNQPTQATNKTLFNNGIVILEGLRLKDVIEGEYQMLALPLKVMNVEALPARVVLFPWQEKPVNLLSR